MGVSRLTNAERDMALTKLPNQTLRANGLAIKQRFKFADFSQAFAFMTRVALLAEQANHHPEQSNVYNHIDIMLTTHDADGLSQRDMALATTISRLL